MTGPALVLGLKGDGAFSRRNTLVCVALVWLWACMGGRHCAFRCDNDRLPCFGPGCVSSRRLIEQSPKQHRTPARYMHAQVVPSLIYGLQTFVVCVFRMAASTFSTRFNQHVDGSAPRFLIKKCEVFLFGLGCLIWRCRKRRVKIRCWCNFKMTMTVTMSP